MRVHSPRRISRSPLAVAVGVSLGLHLLLMAVALLVRAPADPPVFKQGEPLFVELPKADEPAQRGAPALPSPAPKAPPTPPAPPAAKAQPQPRTAPSPPQPSPRPAREPQPRAPEQTAAASPSPPAAAPPEAPAPDGLQAATPPSKPAEPMVNEPARAPERPREAPAPSPSPPRVAAVPPQPPLIDSRSALRRGGPAGAGGAGEGWAGIEGDPIPLDSSDPKYNDYLERVRRMIKEKWGYPCVKNSSSGNCDYKSARLVIVFGILKDGRVPMLEVAQQSGYAIYDDYAANAIRLAQPFPPVPASLLATAKSGSSGVKIVAAFQYVLVESSLTNILR